MLLPVVERRVGTIKILDRRDVERHRAADEAVGRQVVAERVLHLVPPVIVRHDGEDALVEVVGAVEVEGMAARGQQQAKVARIGCLVRSSAPSASLVGWRGRSTAGPSH